MRRLNRANQAFDRPQSESRYTCSNLWERGEQIWITCILVKAVQTYLNQCAERITVVAFLTAVVLTAQHGLRVPALMAAFCSSAPRLFLCTNTSR